MLSTERKSSRSPGVRNQERKAREKPGMAELRPAGQTKVQERTENSKNSTDSGSRDRYLRKSIGTLQGCVGMVS